ncbi:MAG: hypothetical protein AB7T74_02330 [Clostridia bacterium]
MKDLHSQIDVVELIPAATYAADNTPAAVDLLGFESAEVAIAVGAGGITFTTTNKVEFKLTHSDDNSSYAAVTADDLLGVSSVGTGGIVKSLIAAHATADVSRFGYRGGKRYLKLLADFDGTHGTGTPIAAVVVKGNPHKATA